MNWIVLIIGGLFEVLFTFCLGKTKEASATALHLWQAGFIISGILSLYFLTKATQTLPLGTAYLIWTAIATVGTAIIGIIFFHEPATLGRLFFITTLIISIIGLKVV